MEIFSAIQGEGPWVGVHQIFFRLYRCNLRCTWCDTPDSFALTGAGQRENPPGSRRFTEFSNPISPGKALEFLQPFLEKPHHSISFTGGEPLLQNAFLKEIFSSLKRRKEKIFLETGGSLPGLLQELLDFVDFVSMDLKLPSSTGERPLWEKHEAFLRLAAQKELCVKMVLTRDTQENEILQGLRLVKKCAPRACLILQPVTPVEDAQPPTETQLLTWHTLALSYLKEVRVIPQVHKLIGTL